MRRLVVLLGIAGVLVALAGCPQGPVAVIPNTPPLISIEEPVVGPSGDPIPVEEADTILFIAIVDDAEDDLRTLTIHWIAERSDQTSDIVDLGDTQPDATGRSEKQVGGLEPGRWTITAEVEDSNEATDSSAVPIEVLSVNQCPGVTITQPAADAEFVEEELITFVGTVNDDRGIDGVAIEWFDNLDGLLDITGPTDSGLLTFSRNNLSVGDHVVTLTATDTDDAACSTEVEFTVIAGDLPPYDFVVEIDPPDPTTSDDLRCLITQGSADPEGQPIQYIYTWYRDGVPTLIDTDEVTADQTANLEEWTCEVVASDGTLDSNPAIDVVQIGNTLPTVDEAILSPDPAYETSVLLCEGIGFEDTDGDPEGWVATWYVDGLPVPGVVDIELDGTWFDKGQDVWCDLQPWDGFQEGAAVTSNVVAILNSAPDAPGISVTPEPTATIDQDITCLLDVDAIDADGDPILNPDSYEVSWLVNGAPDPSSDGLWILPSVKTALGDEWTCQVRATDGVDWGDYGTASTTVLPLVGDMVISEFHAAPAAVADVAGEWIEVYNASDASVDLAGLLVKDDSTRSGTVDRKTVLAPGQFAVLARGNGSSFCYGFTPNAFYGGAPALNNGGDTVRLVNGNGAVDVSATYGTGDAGVSFELLPGAFDGDANDDFANWAPAIAPLGDSGDYGTPGEAPASETEGVGTGLVDSNGPTSRVGG